MFLVQLDVTVVNVALPRIGRDLHAGLSGQQWVVDSYTVVLAACILGAGVVGDRWGHRTVVVTGLALFGAASLLCGVAPGASALIAARAVQGLAAALLLPSTLAVVNRTFPQREEQARALGVWAGISALALPAGPLLGGALVTSAGWRAVFLINLPVVAVALVMTLRLVAKDAPARTSRLDLPGVLATALTLTALVYCAISAGRSGLSGQVVTAAVLAVVALALLLWWERRTAEPMFPPSLLRKADFIGANGIAAVMNFVGIGAVFVTTLYLQGVQHHSALKAGTMLLPLFVPLAVCAPFTGRIAAKAGPRPPMLAGLLIGTAGAASLVLVGPGSSYAVLIPALLGLGLGMGLLTPSVVAAALRAGPPDRPGLSSGVNNTARQAGGALGIAVFGAMAQSPDVPHRFTDGLHHIGLVSAVLWLIAVATTLRTVPSLDRS
ncbi:MFS transporter [Streptomyces sp. Li-HN-5-11]|uniref:MFS transporter n=1 Tax=Streptomyces sp. Li-HN-5-11 TaxID=3075432 RepID=UPI0028AE1972|nr:MFS transporter [Streptomyces sp. Li-HN-5-11]WNM29987.1 MFS transporter [Streptomyces sp. Li-HN-5-11]